MNLRKGSNGLDIIKTPIIISGTDEKSAVIYKNLTAREKIRYPSVGNGMYKHIDPYSIEDYHNLSKDNKPKVIKVNIKNYTGTALAGHYFSGFYGETVIIWIFLDMLQVKSYSSFFGYLIERDERIFNDIIKVIDEFIETDNKDIGNLTADLRFHRVRNLISEGVNKLFDSPPPLKTKYYGMTDALNSAVEQSRNTISKLGYRFSVIKDRLNADTDIYMEDIGVFLAVYVNIITLGINLSQNKEGYVELYNDETLLIIELGFTLNPPPYLTANCSDIRKLIKTFPKECFNLMLFEQYINYKSWHFTFDITDSARNNFTLKLYAEPITADISAALRASSITRTEFDRQIADIADFVGTLLHIHLGK